ncbi:MAG TPA: hypothetical protein VFA94_15455, partial [Acidimicrobiales bacterium]|nr:hypothetical protein [Acidimicrobiales bacterium]
MRVRVPAVAALFAVQVLLAVPAGAAISVSRADLKAGSLRVEGGGAAPSATVTVDGGAGAVSGKADGSGAFKISASG